MGEGSSVERKVKVTLDSRIRSTGPRPYATVPPRTPGAQVRRRVAGRFRRRPPRRRHHPPPPRGAHRRGGLRDGGDDRRAPRRGPAGRRRRARTVASLIARLRSRHAEVARALLPAGRRRADVLAYVGDVFEELEALAQGLRAAPRAHPAHHRLSRLPRRAAERPPRRGGARGRRDARPSTSMRSTSSTPTARSARRRPTSPGPTAASSGCCGRSSPAASCRSSPASSAPRPSGEVATLGPRRLGPHRHAARPRASARARVSLWKDVPGLLTADPRVVPDARVIPQLHAREAAELAYYGAKVLHPRALIPLAGRRIPVYVRPFADPTPPGTEVSERVAPGRYPGQGAHRRRRPGAASR